MIEIKSNAETAQELAASLKDSGDTLSGVAAATKDEKTILAGNDAAHKPLILLAPKQEKLQQRLRRLGPIFKVLQLDLQLLMKQILLVFTKLREQDNESRSTTIRIKKKRRPTFPERKGCYKRNKKVGRGFEPL